MKNRESYFVVGNTILLFVCLLVYLPITHAQEQQGIESKSRGHDRIEEARDPVTISGTAPKSYKVPPYAPGDYERRISIKDCMRKYLIHVPPSYNPDQPTPAIHNFHGGGSNAKQQHWSSKMDEKSDAAGFITIYPEGSGEIEGLYTFNVEPGYGYVWKNRIDDVLYVAQLLNDMAKLFHIDRRRPGSRKIKRMDSGLRRNDELIRGSLS